MLPEIEFEMLPVSEESDFIYWGSLAIGRLDSRAASQMLSTFWQGLRLPVLRTFAIQLITNFKVVGLTWSSPACIVLTDTVAPENPRKKTLSNAKQCIVVPPAQVEVVPEKLQDNEFLSFLLTFGGTCDVSSGGVGRFASMPYEIPVESLASNEANVPWQGSRVLYQLNNGDTLVYRKDGQIGLHSHEDGNMCRYADSLDKCLRKWLSTTRACLQ